jgi:hypothetical protein
MYLAELSPYLVEMSPNPIIIKVRVTSYFITHLESIGFVVNLNVIHM